MFSALREGSTLYILTKGDSLTLKIGQVIGNPKSYPKYNTSFQYNNPVTNVIDVSVRVGEETMEFRQIPADLEVYAYSNTIISDNVNATNAEVENAVRASQSELDRMPMHENIVKSGNNILKELNPRYKKEKEQEERISGMEGKINGIETTLSNIQSMLSSALNNRKNKD